MGVNNTALLDLVATTLNDLPKQEFEVAWNNVDYEFTRIYQNERMVVDGGTSIERKVMLDPTGNARYRRLFDTDEPAVGDVIHTINVPWTQLSTDYSWDVLELLRNKNSSKGFVSLLKTRRIDGLWSLADLIESRGWVAPTNASDTLYPYGVAYYLNFLNDGITAGDFSGQTIRYQDGSTGTICAGIDAVAEAKWRNWADVYTKVDNSLLKKLRKAFLATKFKPPLTVDDPSGKHSGKKRIYTDLDTAVELQDLADARDDNHGPTDLAGKNLIDVQGTTYFNRIPVVYISELNGASFKPIYCVNFDKFIPIVQDGYWMEESPPMTDRSQHTTLTVFLDGSHNNLCVNRRTCGFVLHTVTS